MNKRLTLATIALVVSLLATTVSTNALANHNMASSQTTTNLNQIVKKKHKSWLFVMHATHGRIERQNGQLYLYLHNVSEDSVAFTDRPYRKYKVIKTRHIINHWHKIFSSKTGGNPNAIVTHAEFTALSGEILPEGLLLKQPMILGRDIRFKVAYFNQTNHSFTLGRTYRDINLFIDFFALEWK